MVLGWYSVFWYLDTLGKCGSRGWSPWTYIFGFCACFWTGLVLVGGWKLCHFVLGRSSGPISKRLILVHPCTPDGACFGGCREPSCGLHLVQPKSLVSAKLLQLSRALRCVRSHTRRRAAQPSTKPFRSRKSSILYSKGILFQRKSRGNGT